MLTEKVVNQPTIKIRNIKENSIVPSNKSFFIGFTSINCVVIMVFNVIYIDCYTNEISCCISLNSITNGFQLLIEPIDVTKEYSIELKYAENKHESLYDSIYDVTNNIVIAQINPLIDLITLNII